MPTQVFTLGNQSLDLPAKAASDQQYFALSGAVVAGSIIKDLFGIDPGYASRTVVLPHAA